IQNFWNGTFREDFYFSVDSDISSGEIWGSLVPADGHDDMTMMFSDGFTMFEVDSDPSSYGHLIQLITGTDSVPVTNYVFITKVDKILEVSDLNWPDEEHIKVAQLVLRSADTTAVEGAFRNQNWNDHIESTIDFQGHLSHITERIRQEYAKWESGCEATVDDSGTDVFVNVTEGIVYQLHKQIFPPLSMPVDDIHVVNERSLGDGGHGEYWTINNLNELTHDADGTDLEDKSFNVVVWGVMNRTGEQSHIMLNLPRGVENDDKYE
ncbi:unnamed protein product, partial [marine sediment metagenome]